MSERYVVTAPVPGGFAWWRVADTFTAEQGNPMRQNFGVADFFRDMPNAEKEARELCVRLNNTQRMIECMNAGPRPVPEDAGEGKFGGKP